MTLPQRTTSAFEIERRSSGTTAHLVVSGELDLGTAPLLRDAYAREDRGCQFVVLDLSGVSFMDSSGLHALVHLNEADPHRLRIILSPEAARVIDLCKLRGALPIIEG